MIKSELYQCIFNLHTIYCECQEHEEVVNIIMFNVSNESCGNLTYTTGSAQSSKIKKLTPGTGPYKHNNSK